MQSTKVHLNKLPSADPENPFIVQTTWNSESIDFQILIYGADTRNPDEYCGSLSIESLQQSANLLEIPFDEFLAENKSALCRHGGAMDFQYEWKSPQFSWRKIKESGVKILYGTIQLINQPNLRHSLLINAVNTNAEQKKTIEELNDRLNLFQKQLDKYTQAFGKCVSEKDALETELLTKFLAILNNKKCKIRELEQQVNDSTMELQSQNRKLNTIQNSSDETIMEQIIVGTQKTNDFQQLSQSPENSPELIVPKRKRYLNTFADDSSNNVAGCSDYLSKRNLSQKSVDSKEGSPSIYDRNTDQLLEEM